MVTAFIALGSNVGDRLSHLQAALDHLAKEVQLRQASLVYETAPMYVTDQPSFFNAAIRIETSLSPSALLALLKSVEREVGRQARERYGPREVDLDLISYGTLQYTYRKDSRLILQLPHPRTGERRFVLQPLYDMQPDLLLAGLGTVESLLGGTEDQVGDLQRRDDAVLSI